MVEFWMSTLLPEFWITVGKPAELVNAPPETRLFPLILSLASVSVIVPVTTWLLTLLVMLVPPLMSSNVAVGVAAPNDGGGGCSPGGVAYAAVLTHAVKNAASAICVRCVRSFGMGV